MFLHSHDRLDGVIRIYRWQYTLHYPGGFGVLVNSDETTGIAISIATFHIPPKKKKKRMAKQGQERQLPPLRPDRREHWTPTPSVLILPIHSRAPGAWEG